MLANTETWPDVKKYYLNTIIVCPEVDAKLALLVESVGDCGMKVMDGRGEKGFIDWSEQAYQIESPLPLKRQWYQSGEFAALIQRIPARMWRKGINSENTQLRTFNSDGGLGVFDSIKLTSIQTFLEQRATFVETLTETTLLGKKSLALAPQWCFRPKNDTLYLYHAPVGKLSMSRQLVSILKEFNTIPLPGCLQHWNVKYV